MANQGFTNSLIVEVEGTPLRPELAVALIYAYVDDSQLLPDAFLLRFRDPGHNVLDKAGVKIGAKVKLKGQAGDSPSPELLLSGEVTALSVDIDTTGTLTEIRGYDHSHRLLRGRRVAAYANMTISDVVRKVAQRANLGLGTVDSFGETSQDSEITQENITDWELLTRLADLTGAELTVEDGKLSFQRPPESSSAPSASARARQDPLVLEAGQNVTAVRATVSSAEQVGKVVVRGWNYLAKEAVTGNAQAQTESAQLAAVTPVALAQKFGNGTFVATDVPHRTQSSVDAAAKALAEQIAGAFAEIEGVAKGNPKLRAGSSVALSGCGKPFEGKYTLSSTRHLFTEDTGYTTLFAVSGRQERSLYGLSHGGHERNGHHAVSGLVPAVVTDVKDPRKMGRVKLKFPWLADDYQSSWARTVQVSAGNNYGAVILPEVGDEVLVGFDQGDFDTPYVLGGLYNGKDAPATAPYPFVEENSGKVAARRLVSRTGHKLEMVETTAADNVVRLVTGDGKHSLELDKKGTKVTLKSDGTVLVEGTRGVTIDAKTGPLELKGGTVSIKATGGLKIDGATVAVNGQGAAEFKAGGVVTVQGSLVKIN